MLHDQESLGKGPLSAPPPSRGHLLPVHGQERGPERGKESFLQARHTLVLGGCGVEALEGQQSQGEESIWGAGRIQAEPARETPSPGHTSQGGPQRPPARQPADQQFKVLWLSPQPPPPPEELPVRAEQPSKVGGREA